TFNQTAHANVVEDHLPQVTTELTLGDDAGRWYPDTLIIDVLSVGVESDHSATADISIMPLRQGPESDLAVPEDRASNRDVREVGAATVGVIMDKDIPFVDVIAEEIDDS